MESIWNDTLSYTRIPENNVTVTLQDLNDEEARRRLAPMIYLGILIFVGIPGNITVLLVFLTKDQRCSHETFILGLAWIDLIACVVCMPFEIIEMNFQYLFYSATVCKVFRFGDKLIAYASIFVIIALSVDRYRRVCHPFMRQMTITMAKCICFVAICISLLLSWPTLFLSGTRTVDLGYNITGFDCSTSDTYRKTEYPFIHNIVLFTVFLVCLVTLCILYILIGREIFSHYQFRSIFISSVGSPKKKQKYDMSPSEKLNGNEPTIELINMRSKSSSNTSLLKELYNIAKPRHLTEEEKERRKSRKVTTIAFLIMLSFTLSYLPHMILVTMTAIKRGFLVKPGPIASSLLPIVVRSFFINNVINPFIYGICDSHFREMFKQLFCKHFRCGNNV